MENSLTTCDSVNNPEVESLFHWNTEPEDRTKTCSRNQAELSTWNTTAIGITNFFVTLLQDFLDEPNNVHSDDLRELLTKKKIPVTSMQSFDTDEAGEAPRVIVEFSGKQSQQNFAINNKFGYNIHNSSADYYSHWQIGVSLYVIGNTINETLLLAEEVSNFCHCFQEQICKSAGFLRCQLAEVGKPQCLSESSSQRSFLSTISISVVVANVWSVHVQAPVLKRVTFKYEANNNFINDK